MVVRLQLGGEVEGGLIYILVSLAQAKLFGILIGFTSVVVE
jgi:hypothetical protein